MTRHLGGQLDDVAIGVAEINRLDHAVVGDAAGVDTLRLAFGEHRVQGWRVDFEGDVQVEIALRFEVEGHVWRFEKCQAGAVVHLKERMQHVGPARRLGFMLVGTVTALWSNPWFVRMTPAAGFEVALLAAQCLLGGLYLGIRAPSCGVKSAGSGSVLGMLGVACPICNKVLLAIFGSGLLLTYFEPIRLYVGLLGTGILLFALYRKLAARATTALVAV